ncbi:MAG TPA: hypothetical protein VNA69_13385 [Thermoanaerobaculia bacterium]|nr:hypothetical protein [Thermoanaerobaculia bacterium]
MDLIDVEPRQSDVRFDVSKEMTAYCVLGFPASKNKPLAPGRLSRGVLFGHWSDVCDISDYVTAKADVRTHLVVPMARNGMNDDERFVVAPKPHGMSGGPVWRVRFRLPDLAITIRLVGMAVEYRKDIESAVALRIWVIMNLIRSAFPDLADKVPRATTFAETGNGSV